MIYKNYLFMLGICALTSLQAQQNATVSGGVVSGSSGTVSYSIGETLTNLTTNGSYSLNSGVIQAYTISETLNSPEDAMISVSLKAFPNPATDVLVLSATNAMDAPYTYMLYSLEGKQLLKGQLTANTAHVNMQSFRPGTYILKINKDNTLIKSFKIIKN
ncbi:T9SS type A sorting domain-containing protein [Jejuia pallidilutea]|uniref:Secretion system C-terminal sorting domain-containing protein n=2 Tax=Jejuia pallidilutea TaxID=504487 RepID=A0A090WRQ9_9FLAO|nr:T9SS type A sorting domain-containing protein [Jejuia pallidilutea]GAL70092.1 hypothetical protein JCM19302_2667 [Jejuia pallidilutea]